MQLPKFIWITEISTEEIFRNKEIIGEIILDATAGRYEEAQFISIHYPGLFIYNPRHISLGGKNMESFTFNINNKIKYNLYSHNLGEEEGN